MQPLDGLRNADVDGARADPQPPGRSVGGDVRRRQLVDEAAALFDREGYHHASVEQIASAVGLSKATLYHYFRSKDEILYWIHEEFIDLLISRHETRLRTPMTAKQYLLEIMDDILELGETHRGHVRVFFEHYRELPPAQAQKMAERRDHYLSMVEDVVQHGMDDGEFRSIDVRLATLALFGMCNWAYHWYKPGGPMRTREIAYVFWDLLLAGINAPASTAGDAT